MKTIKPIVIESKKNETILSLAKRAINNATINTSIVELIMGGVKCLVFPNDNFSKVVHYVKLQSIVLRMKELEAS